MYPYPYPYPYPYRGLFLTVTGDCSCLVIILSFRINPLPSQILKTASHSATKLNSYIDPYTTMCSECFGVDPDYHSGSRAKSVFSNSPHYLQNLSSDLQLQYLCAKVWVRAIFHLL